MPAQPGLLPALQLVRPVGACLRRLLVRAQVSVREGLLLKLPVLRSDLEAGPSVWVPLHSRGKVCAEAIGGGRIHKESTASQLPDRILSVRAALSASWVANCSLSIRVVNLLIIHVVFPFFVPFESDVVRNLF